LRLDNGNSISDQPKRFTSDHSTKMLQPFSEVESTV